MRQQRELDKGHGSKDEEDGEEDEVMVVVS